MSEMEDTVTKMERKVSQAAKRQLAAEKRAGRAHSPKPPTKVTTIITLKDGGKNEKII